MGMFSSADQAKVTGKFESFKRGNFSAADTATVLNNTADILNKSADGPLAKFFDDIKTMCLGKERVQGSSCKNNWYDHSYIGLCFFPN